MFRTEVTFLFFFSSAATVGRRWPGRSSQRQSVRGTFVRPAAAEHRSSARLLAFHDVRRQRCPCQGVRTRYAVESGDSQLWPHGSGELRRNGTRSHPHRGPRRSEQSVLAQRQLRADRVRHRMQRVHCLRLWRAQCATVCRWPRFRFAHTDVQHCRGGHLRFGGDRPSDLSATAGQSAAPERLQALLPVPRPGCGTAASPLRGEPELRPHAQPVRSCAVLAGHPQRNGGLRSHGIGGAGSAFCGNGDGDGGGVVGAGGGRSERGISLPQTGVLVMFEWDLKI